MDKINKMLVIAKVEAQRRERVDIDQVFERMTTEQLQELAYGEPSETRIHEIFASVDGLHLLESG